MSYFAVHSDRARRGGYYSAHCGQILLGARVRGRQQGRLLLSAATSLFRVYFEGQRLLLFTSIQ